MGRDKQAGMQDSAPKGTPEGRHPPSEPWRLGAVGNPLVNWDQRDLSRYLFGTPEEILQRRPGEDYHYSGDAPEDRPTRFKMIKPASTSKSLNDPAITTHAPTGSAPSKFGNARRYLRGS